MEWARFRKYARRMRELNQLVTLDSEVFSVMQLSTINEPLLPNLKSLRLCRIEETFIPFIPLFLSPRTIYITLRFFEPDLPNTAVASMITAFPTVCPNLQVISLLDLPSDPMITTAVSGMLLATNQNTLQWLYVDSPLTEQVIEMLFKLPNLRGLDVLIEETSPSTSLPNLTELITRYNNASNWPRLFHGAILGKLESITFIPRSEQIGDLLGAFKRAALPLCLQNTLSKFHLYTPYSWNPDYSSLLPFMQLVDLDITSSCDGGCSSRVDDNTVINLSRAMPKLETLVLGSKPCSQFTTGVTAKGLVALARNCPDLFFLRIHFQVASLSIPPTSPRMAPDVESTASRVDCGLMYLDVGEIPVPEESVLIVALTLSRIFPHISEIFYSTDDDKGWEKVESAINDSQRIVDYSSKQHPSHYALKCPIDPSTGATPGS